MLYPSSFDQDKNGFSNKNLLSIQKILRVSEPVAEKYKKVYKDLHNIMILTNSATPGEFHLTLVHTTVGNNSLGKSVVVFVLAGDLSSPSVFPSK